VSESFDILCVDWGGSFGVVVDVACGAKLDVDCPCREFVPSSCNLGFEKVIWAFATDGEDGVFEVSLALSEGTGAASSWLWRRSPLLEYTAGTDAELGALPARCIEVKLDGSSGLSVVLWGVDVGCFDLTRARLERFSGKGLSVLRRDIQRTSKDRLNVI
jgi:hypothetical protein